eukprot:Lithocolla_globosa_v1_NODE_1876_length_2280_cov_11.819775.p1 type:complete len:553 gc:universal NODE_1876_length_2280_cov_11.819775:1751-93(-)
MLTTDFGPIHCRFAGSLGDPLILLVHGSGPANSGLWWCEFTHQFLLLSQAWKKFFLVSIDCPGYGFSPGSHQTIRSNPAQLIASIIKALNYSQAYCLVGSSQGACSIFNAVLESPSLTHFLAVMDPVGHDVFRYKRIKQPTFLVFDVDDDGHPVKVGRWMRDQLPKAHYYEFSSKKQPCWHVDNMPASLLRMFQEHDLSSISSSYLTLAANAVKETMQVVGYLSSWFEAKINSWPCKSLALLDRPYLDQDRKAIKKTENKPSYRCLLDSKTGQLVYMDSETGQTLVAAPVTRMSTSIQPNDMAEKDNDEGKDLFSEQVEVQQENSSKIDEEKERKQILCDVCQELLLQPVRLNGCRHALCRVCVLETFVELVRHCPVLGCDNHETGKIATDSDSDWQQQILSQCSTANRELTNVPLFEKKVAKLSQQQKESHCILLEYGNTCQPKGDGQKSSERFEYKTFVRIAKVKLGTKAKKLPDKSTLLRRVDFNINPEYPSSAIKVLKQPFTLARVMNREYPCNITVYWNSNLKQKPLQIPFTVKRNPKTSHRLVVVI